MTPTIAPIGPAPVPLGAPCVNGVLVDLVQPLVGFPGSHHFAVEALGPARAPFARMSSLDEAGLAFIVAPPGALYPDYRFELGEDDVALLGLTSASEVETWVILSRSAAKVPTANLLGPIVVHRTTRLGLQVVLHESGYGAAVPLGSPTARPPIEA